MAFDSQPVLCFGCVGQTRHMVAESAMWLAEYGLMRFAFCLYRYFPHGGMQRNFLRIAEECRSRGHSIEVYTLRWDGESPGESIQIHLLPPRGWQNHTRHEAFARQVQALNLHENHDLVVGFNRMPGLDAYYCADPCFMDFVHRNRSAMYRQSPRFRHFRKFERAVFHAEAATRILLLSPVEKVAFQKWYGTPDWRFALLPPYVSRDRLSDVNDRHAARQCIRHRHGLSDDAIVLLMIGSDFRRKGVDRAVRATAALPEQVRRNTHLLVIGRGKAWRYERLARRLGIAGHVHLLQGRDDVGSYLAGSDLLLHVAREENTGTAIVEAIASGLPALVTANCGYAFHLHDAGAGLVVEEPFEQAALDARLTQMLQSGHLASWRSSALAYAKQTDLFSRPQRAAELLEQWASDRRDGSLVATQATGPAQ